MKEISVVRTDEGFLGLKSDWNRLARCFFETFEWNWIWWRYFGNGRNLYIILAKDKEIKTIAPLFLYKGRLRFIGDPQSDYCDLIGDKTDVADILEKISLIGGELNEIPAGSRTLGLNLPNSHIYFCNPAPRLEMDTCLDFLDKKRLRKKSRNIEKIGGEFVRITDINDAKAAIETMFELHIRRWNSVGQLSRFQEKVHRDFKHALIDELLESGRFGIWVLRTRSIKRTKSKIISVCCGFYQGDVFYSYCHVHDIEYNKYSIGIGMMRALVLYQKEHGIKMIDHGRGAETYKNNFSSKVGENHGIGIYRNMLSNRIMQIYHDFREIIIRNPSFHDRICNLRNRLKYILGRDIR